MAAPNKIFCSLVALLLSIGIYDVLTNFEPNRCSMSYMWEIPEYIAVHHIDDAVQQKYPHYSLTLYGEGKYAKDIKKMKLTGIPVLFIPGNAGSHKQVRSLSSVALRKATKYNFHFNYFSVNLNEELNGVYGGVLEGQTEYVHTCIKHILELYKKNPKNKDPPKQVVIIAHSKGGLVAKALFARPDFDSSMVNTLITMGTPHVTSVFKPDIYMDQFTSNVDKYWVEKWNSSDLTVLSIGGGYRDNMVRSGLTSMDGITTSDRGLSVVVGSIPRVWLSTDHRCIVWCKELVLATNRALFDMVDKLTKQISVNPEYRMRVLKHHFVSHDGQSSYSPHTEDVVGFDADNFKAIDAGFHHVAGRHTKGPMHYTFPLNPDDPNQEGFALTATVPATSGWLFVCTRSHEERCISGVDITRRARLMPPLKSDTRSVHLDLKDLGVAPAKQIVVKVPNTNKVNMIADVFKRSDRMFSATLPGLFSYKPKTIMKQHDSHSLFFNISLPELDSVWKAYTVTLEPAHCFDPVRKDGNTTLRLHVPWFHEDEWSVAKATEDNVLSVKLQSGRPAGDDRSAQIHAYVYSRCHYRLKVAVSHKEVFGQLVRFYGYLLPCFVVDVALLVVSYMLLHIATNKPLESFITVQSTFCKPYVVVPIVSLIQKVLPSIYNPLAEASYTTVLETQNIHFPLLPMLFFLFGYGVLCIMSAIMELDVAIFGKLLSLFKGTSMTLDSPESSGSLGYSVLLYAVLGGMSAMCVGACGGVVLMLLTVMYLLRVISLQARVYILEGCLNLSTGQAKDASDKDKEQEKEKKEEEEEEKKEKNGTPETGTTSQEEAAAAPNVEAPPPTPLDVARSSLNFHFAFMMLTLLLALLNIPSLAVWVKNMRHEVYNLERDPALYPTLVVIAALSVLLDPAYATPRKGVITRGLSWAVYIITLLAVLYAADATYRLSYLIAATMLLGAANQALL